LFTINNNATDIPDVPEDTLSGSPVEVVDATEPVEPVEVVILQNWWK
jgi:hypothetical protein